MSNMQRCEILKYGILQQLLLHEGQNIPLNHWNSLKCVKRLHFVTKFFTHQNPISKFSQDFLSTRCHVPTFFFYIHLKAVATFVCAFLLSAFFCSLYAMALLGSQNSCALLASFLSLLVLVVSLQCHIASSAVLSGMKQDHDHVTHQKPLLQTNQSTCSLFVGAWVLDETETYPLYHSSSCPIIDPEFNCQMYGRPDSGYLRYRWKPLNCELPRYNHQYWTQHHKKWNGFYPSIICQCFWSFGFKIVQCYHVIHIVVLCSLI